MLSFLTLLLPDAEVVVLAPELGAAVVVIRRDGAGDTGEVLDTVSRSPGTFLNIT